MQSCALFKTAI